MSEIRPDEIEVTRGKQLQIKLQIAGGVIFAALSTVVAVVLSPIINASRIIGWGIAMFDPTSWIWIICFLLFGTMAGIISCVVGSFGLLIIDYTGIGPAFKFFATIPLIIIPFLILRLREKGVINSQKLKDPRRFAFTGVISIIVRIGVMLILNFLFFAIVWGIDTLAFVNLEVLGLGNITGVTALLIFTPIINLYSGVLDLVIPYFIVFVTRLDEKFEIW